MSRLAGHDLIDEGAAFVKAGRWSNRITPRGTGGVGRGKCLCGALSDVLDSGNKRKAWHREHKAEVRVEQAAQDPEGRALVQAIHDRKNQEKQ